MAEDKLIFPIGFDLEKGVKEAQGDVDKYLNRIAKAVEKHPLSVKIQIDKDGGISSTIKAERQRAAKELTGLQKEMAEINKEWNALSAKDRGGEMGARLIARYRELTQEAKGYTSTIGAAVKLEDRLARQREKSANAAAKAAQKTREYNNELKSQDGYISRLVKRLAVYASFSAVRTFLTSVRDVTAEFELQRVSLGAIIQDQQRANQLFSEIKAFALKSPLKILDLTKYVKQVAAYRIETDKLFDTTKRLADVSVGLGVDMGRLVLAYGQVKAASYLRAAEIRQFTEAGIPMLELLADKFTEIQGKAVSTEQVMDLVSKRAVSFSMVEEIFKDMTDAGGMFYNMQEKQAQTLFGMWSKLGDAAAVMYEEIGNTGWVNAGMKEAIGLLESMMRNWRGVTSWISAAGGAFLVIKGAQVILKMIRVNTIAAAVATRNYARAQEQLNAAKQSGSKLLGFIATHAARAAAANRKAATSTNLWAVANYKLKASFSSAIATLKGGWIGIVITAIAAVVSMIVNASRKAKELNNELAKISAEGANKADEMTRNFERLAKVVVESADGSKRQNEALEELKRTYSDIIPAQDLTIDKLREMKGAYGEVTKAIREKIYQQNLEQQISTIQEKYGGEISKGEEKTKELLKGYGLSSEETGRVISAIRTAIDNGLLKVEDLAKDRANVIAKIIKDTTGIDLQFTYKSRGVEWLTNDYVDLSVAITKVVKPTIEMNAKIKEQTEYMEGLTGTLGEYSNEWKRVQKEIEDNKIIAGHKDSQFLVSKQNDNNKIKSWAASLKTVLGNAWDEAFVSLEESVGEKGDKMSYIIFDKLLSPEVYNKLSTQQRAYIRMIQEEYNNLIPQDRTVQALRNRLIQISKDTGVSMDEMKRHLMNAGESWADYSKRIHDEIKGYEDRAEEMQKANAAVAATVTQGGKGPLKMPYTDKEIKQVEGNADALKMLLLYLQASSKGGRSGSDTRLQNLKEEISLTKKLYDEYQKLEKQIGATKAAEKIQQIYSNTIKTLQDRAKKYGFEFKMPFTDENLKANMQHFIDKMKELQKLKDKKGNPLFPNIGKEIDESVAQLEDVDLNSLQKALEKKLKELADKISRTKTAKEFYDKILGHTGDTQLAIHLTTSIYGEDGQDLKKQTADQVKRIFSDWNIEMPLGIVDNEENINYGVLRKYAEEAKRTKAIGESVANELIKIADNGEKELSRIAQEGAKLLLKYDEIAQQRVNIEQEASNQIKQLRDAEVLYLASKASEGEKAAYTERINKAVAGVEADRDLKLLKLQDNYLRFFSAIHTLTKKEANELRTNLRTELFKTFQAGAISAQQLKKELEAIDKQFNKLKNDNGLVVDYLSGGFDGLLNKVQDLSDELTAVSANFIEMGKNGQHLDAEGNILDKNNDIIGKIDEGRKNYINQILKIFGNDQTGNSFASLLSNTNGDLGQMGNLLQGVSGNMSSFAGAASGALGIVDMIIKGVHETIQGFAAIRDQINAMRSDTRQLEGGFWDAFQYLEEFDKYAFEGWEKLKSGDAVGATVSTVQSIISIFGVFQQQKVKRLNKEIERQQDILDQLSYSYGRLEAATEKAFGGDYIKNFKDQQANLQAQITATEKQLQAERAKGKGTDDKKVKEYKEQIRDLKDQLADMQGALAEQFLGTDLTSAARDFAKAWLDAYKEFGNTADAMSEKFQEMIENMVVEGLLARVMQQALEPAFKMVDEYKGDFSDEDFWREVVAKAEQGAEDANAGATIVMKFLEQAGLSIRDLGSDLTGISRDIASASEESINGLAAGINTQNYYISYVPQIAEHVAAMRAILENGGNPIQSGPGITDLVTLQNQSLTHLQAINQHTAETVTECRRIAERCTAMAEDIHRVVVPKGTKGAYSMQVQMPA